MSPLTAGVLATTPLRRGGGSLCERQRHERAAPFAVPIPERVGVTAMAVVAVPAVGAVNDGLVFGRPVFVDPVVHLDQPSARKDTPGPKAGRDELLGLRKLDG